MGCTSSDENNYKKQDLRVKKHNVSISHVKKRSVSIEIFGKCNAGKTSLYTIFSGKSFDKLPPPTLNPICHKIPLSTIDSSNNLEPCDVKLFDLPGIENRGRY